MSKEYCVYVHTFPNGKKYVGITNQRPEKRWGAGNHYAGCPHMNNAIKKYGWENVNHEILLENLNKDEAIKFEKMYIKKFDSIKNGYNLSIGGSAGRATYLNSHVLEMIRMSDKADLVLGKRREQNDIISWAEKAKKDKDLAELFNWADEIVERDYSYYKKLKSTPFSNKDDVQSDHYWYYVMQLVQYGEIKKMYDIAWGEYISQ